MTYKPYKNEETRTSILAGVRTGAEEAWGRFFDTYAGYVFAIATHAGLVGSDADEIVQTVFTELSRPGGFDGYERGKGSFRAWLRRRAQWRVIDELRRRAASRVIGGAEGARIVSAIADPGTALDEFWSDAVHREAMRRLGADSDPVHLAIFQASVMEEVPTEEIMAMYHVSRANVYQIRKRMKAAYEKHFRSAMEDMDAPQALE